MAQGTIPIEHHWRYFFHMTDIDNLESILKNGLLCTNEKNRLGIRHTNIANMTIQERRAIMRVPCGHGGTVHDYVPFYLTSKNPMLLGQINAKNCDQPRIIFLCLKIQKLVELDAIFTNSSANTNISPDFYDNTSHLSDLSWQLIDSPKWGKFSDDERHKKMAEVLIYQKVMPEDIDTIVTFNEIYQQRVETILAKTGKSIKVSRNLQSVWHQYYFYFTKFTFAVPERRRETLVVGPKFIQYAYEQLLKKVREAKVKDMASNPTYPTLHDLLQAIRTNFCAILELQGIWNLKTSNPMHPETVSEHTLRVVETIKQTEYYKNADAHKKDLLELAAYLHDIGKGPHTKWKDGVQPPYLDHPYDAISMLARIFTQEIREVDDEDVRVVGLLVAYHDIIGDSATGERNIKALRPILKSEDDFDMLACLSEADIRSIDINWWYNVWIKIDELKSKVFSDEQ